MTEYDYAGIAARLESRNLDRPNDAAGIMALLGYEVAAHRRTGLACRSFGESHWQSLPNFNSADDAELWITEKTDSHFDDIGRNADGSIYISLNSPQLGNDYGNASRIGTAMWAAFVRLFGKVGGED